MSMKLKGVSTKFNDHLDAGTAGRLIVNQLKAVKGVGEDDLVIDDKKLFELDWNCRELEDAKEAIAKKANYIKDRLDRVLGSLESDCFSPNSCGELQANGPDFDMAIAVYCERAKQFEKYLRKEFPEFIDKQ